MNPEQPFTKDDPAYPGMIGLIAATTATDCKCSRCERLRGFLPPEIDSIAQSSQFKERTSKMYEQSVAARDEAKLRRNEMLSQKMRERRQRMKGTPQYEVEKQKARERAARRRQRKQLQQEREEQQ